MSLVPEASSEEIFLDKRRGGTPRAQVHAYEGAAKTQACDPGGPFHDPGCTLYFSPAEAREPRGKKFPRRVSRGRENSGYQRSISAQAAKHPIQSGASAFRQSNFNALSKVKFITVLDTLWHGAHVLFSDVGVCANNLA